MNKSSGIFCVDYWTSNDLENGTDPSDFAYSDDEDQIRERLGHFLRTGRFHYAILYKAEVAEEWVEIATFRAA